MTIETVWKSYDVVVVGSGGAGAMAASAAAESGARVLVVSKDPIGCSDTKISEGVATVRQTGAEDDTVDGLSENLKMAGADLPLQDITDAFAEDSQEAYDKYRAQGLRPSIDPQNQKPQALPLPMGGHTRRRSVGHQNSGVAFGHANWQAVVQSGEIDYLEDAWFLDLVTEDKDGEARVIGGRLYDAAGGKLVAVKSPAVVIAAGGLSTLYFPKTDTMRGNTGDSYAVAARAGADLVDMEQVQFLPFCLASPPSYEGLLAGEPSTASFLGVLRDKNGKVILDGVYLRTRAECSAAIMRAVEDGRGSPNGGAYLDMRANKSPPKSGPYFQRYLETTLPTAFQNARQALGKEAARCETQWEVRPAAHYMMGGIRVDENGCAAGGVGKGTKAEGLTGLFAAGQAMGGLFGANRLGSTSLTELAVFGTRAGTAAAVHARGHQSEATEAAFKDQIDSVQSRFGQNGDRAAAALKATLQERAWDAIGPVRNEERLRAFEQFLDDLERDLDQVAVPAFGLWNQSFLELEELRNMIETARAVTLAALERDGSVGGHVRLDKQNISAFATPYSTIVARDTANAWSVRREARPRTPIKRLLSYKVKDQWRKWQAKAFRYLPAGVQDRKLEQRYVAIMGRSGGAPETYPGAPEAAVAEARS